MYKTWIKLSKSALSNNVKIFRSKISPSTNLWAVIKSNAYGHGLWTFAKMVSTIKYNGKIAVNGFCVDSVTEGVKLRQHGITLPILVLGPTFGDQYLEAKKNNITVSIATKFALNQLIKEIPNSKNQPAIHIKINTGMNRQGFPLSELKSLIKILKQKKLNLTGVFSHLASAKDINYPTFSDNQLEKFKTAGKIFKKSGFIDINYHLSATAGTMLGKKYQFNTVRIGIGLYGIFPSLELEEQLHQNYNLQPVLSWHSIISEIKNIPAGSFVGYDFTERVNKKTTIAIIPIGYWHGLPWALSRIGNILVGGKKAKILGRVSMDMTTIDITGIPAKILDEVTIIGKQKNNQITAEAIARDASTTPYEIITRINPLIHRSTKK